GDDQALVVAQSLEPIDHTLHNLGIVLWSVGLLGVIGAALAGNAVAASGLRPLARLTGAAEHVARTEDLQPIPVTGSDEISRLAQPTRLCGDRTGRARDTPQVRNAELIELSNVVEDAVIKVRRRAPGLDWDVQLTPFPVWGDERLLGRAVTNLLDNAAKYSVP